MAATRMFLKSNSKLSFQFLRNPTLAAPQLTKSINEALNQKSPQPISEFTLCEFLGTSQKLFTGEAGFVGVPTQFAQRAVTGESLRIEVRGSKKQRIDEDDEDGDGDGDEVDEDFDDVEDEFDDDFGDSFNDDSECGDDDDDDIRSLKKNRLK